MTDQPQSVPAPRKSGGSVFSNLSAFDHPFAALRAEMDRLFDDFFSSRPAAPNIALASGSLVTPHVDVSETEKAYRITAELPGLDKKDVQVTIEDGVLTLSGEKKEDRKEESEGRYLSERSYGRFTRSFRLPDDVIAKSIQASMDKGIMNIDLPRAEQPAKPKAKTIKIN